jgi:hypothetical protein
MDQQQIKGLAILSRLKNQAVSRQSLTPATTGRHDKTNSFL